MTPRTKQHASVLAAVVVTALAGITATAPANATIPSPTSSATPTAGAGTPTVAPSATPTARPSVLPTATPTATRKPRPTPTVTPAPRPTPTPTRTPTPTPTPVVPLPVATALSTTSGHSASSRTVRMTGSRFGNLAGVRVAGVPVANLVVLSDTSVRFVLPNALDYQPKVAAVTLTARSDLRARPTGLTFEYKVANKLDRQMAYAFRYWNVYSNSTFGYLSGNDCANFTSQTLLARGWKRSAQWYNDGPGDWSGTWVSSTALSNWLKKRPDLATRLNYRERDAVTVGDVVQFRWPGHSSSYSSWEHTAVVSKVVVLPDGRHDIYYVAHTNNRQYGGGTTGLATYYAKQKITGSTLRIQFFHLKK